jgi:chemotaxis protein MotB
MAAGKRDGKTIIIRREEVVEGGHHGGAWKVAYADFVTAMMAFFLLMWLLNFTTPEQREGLADYFSPNSLLAHNRSGFGKPFGGITPNVSGSFVSDKGAVRVVQAKPHPYVDAADEGDGPPASEETAGTTPVPGAGSGQGEATHPYRLLNRPSAEVAGQASAPQPVAERSLLPMKADEISQLATSPAAKERAAFEQAAKQIRDLVRSDPDLAALGHQLAVDITPQGLRVQLLDADNRPMFDTGSSTPSPWTRALLAKVVPALLRLPEPVSIAGYTDAQPFRGGDRTNWELSSDRANATRRLLVEAGLPESRLQGVSGHADHELLLPADPMAAANRRVAITVLRQAPTLPTVPAPAATPQDDPTKGEAHGAANTPAR